MVPPGLPEEGNRGTGWGEVRSQGSGGEGTKFEQAGFVGQLDLRDQEREKAVVSRCFQLRQ